MQSNFAKVHALMFVKPKDIIFSENILCILHWPKGNFTDFTNCNSAIDIPYCIKRTTNEIKLNIRNKFSSGMLQQQPNLIFLPEN